MIEPRIWLAFFAAPFRDLAPVAGLALAAIAIIAAAVWWIAHR